MKIQNYTFDERWRKLESARNQTRRVAYTMMAAVLTSLFVAMKVAG